MNPAMLSQVGNVDESLVDAYDGAPLGAAIRRGETLWSSPSRRGLMGVKIGRNASMRQTIAVERALDRATRLRAALLEAVAAIEDAGFDVAFDADEDRFVAFNPTTNQVI